MAQYRTAFITGASSGIGAAVAMRLAKAGVAVVLAARRQDQLRAVAEEIAAAGGQARVEPLDVTDPRAVHETMQRVDAQMDGIELVVANAGVGKARWSGKLTWPDIEPTLAVNVVGATATLTALLPRMVERGRGHLVGISSLAAYRGLPKQAVYSASKAYLSHFLEALRADLQDTPIAVTDIRPGYVKTPMTEHNQRMPFVIEVEEASAEIHKAIVQRRAVHAFPAVLAAGARSMTALPGPLYRRLASKVLG